MGDNFGLQRRDRRLQEIKHHVAIFRERRGAPANLLKAYDWLIKQTFLEGADVETLKTAERMCEIALREEKEYCDREVVVPNEAQQDDKRITVLQADLGAIQHALRARNQAAAAGATASGAATGGAGATEPRAVSPAASRDDLLHQAEKHNKTAYKFTRGGLALIVVACACPPAATFCAVTAMVAVFAGEANFRRAKELEKAANSTQ